MQPWVKQRVTWSLTVVLACLLVEWVSPAQGQVSKPARVAIEAALHASLGIVVWAAFTRGRSPSGKPFISASDALLFMAPAAAVGAGLDVDHVLAGVLHTGSWSLAAASALPDRPAGHNWWVGGVMLPVLVAGAVAVFARFRPDRSASVLPSTPAYWAALTAVVVTSHQLRDALRRGMWLSPAFLAPSAVGSTPRLPLWVYVAASVCLAALGEVAGRWAGLELASPRPRHARDGEGWQLANGAEEKGEEEDGSSHVGIPVDAPLPSTPNGSSLVSRRAVLEE